VTALLRGDAVLMMTGSNLCHSCAELAASAQIKCPTCQCAACGLGNVPGEIEDQALTFGVDD
jgi:hypothetical protein